VTPAKLTLDKGDHNFTFKKSGYLTAAKSATLKPGEPYTYNATLAKETSTSIFSKIFGGGDKVQVQVRSDPKGAEIWVNDNFLNKRTPSKIGLAPGDYEITLKMDGYKPLTRKVTVTKDSSPTVNETLQK